MTLIDLFNPQQTAAQCDYKRVSSLPHILDSFWQNHQGHWQICLTFDTFPPSALWALQNAEYSVMTKTTSNPKCEHGHSLLDCRYCLMWPLNSY